MATAIRVLFVDDDPGILDIGKQFLEQSGDFAVMTATSAPDAIQLLGQERFEVIVSDYQMPEMNGIAFLKQVRMTGIRSVYTVVLRFLLLHPLLQRPCLNLGEA